MDEKTFHRITGPTEWAQAPAEFSFSSLREMEACPRRWQLAHSSYQTLKRCPSRAVEAAIVGTIIHEVLEALVGALTDRGLPEPDSDLWCEAMAAVGVMATVRAKLVRVEQEHVHHPRDPGFRVKRTAREINNEVLGLLRSQAARARRTATTSGLAGESHAPQDALQRLQRRGMLAEHPVRHPSLPVRGVIDLVVRTPEGTKIVDFKTGVLKPEYRNQLELYATMWFRETGDLPVALEISHGEGIERFPFDRGGVDRVEVDTRGRVEGMRTRLSVIPAEARPGDECVHCSVRPFCDAYWALPTQGRLPSDPKWMDLEVVVMAVMSDNGVEARSSGGDSIAVTYPSEVGRRAGPFALGDTLRILGAWVDREKSEARLTAASEVFVHPMEIRSIRKS